MPPWRLDPPPVAEPRVKGRFPLPTGVRGSAEFSTDRRYRYRLGRRWDDRRPAITFVLLNPSRADGDGDDPTTRKLWHLAVEAGAGAYELVNLFALVDTAQAGLHRAAALGPGGRADRRLRSAIECSDRLVVGWGDGRSGGDHAAARRAAIERRVSELRPLLEGRDLWCVSVNRTTGSPRHPGRGVRNDAPLLPFDFRTEPR